MSVTDIQSQKLKFVRRSLYVGMIIYIVYLLPNWDSVFSVHQLNPAQSGNWRALFEFTHPSWMYSNHGKWIPFFILFFCVIGLILHESIIISIIVWYGVVVFFNQIEIIQSGGHHLIRLLLFYNIFLLPNASLWWNRLWLMIMQFQVILLYANSAYFKLMGIEWVRGEAVWYTAQIPLYSNKSFNAWLNYPVSIFLTYSALLYQILFPLAIWVKKIKKIVLLSGLLFHVGIFWIMGLFDFAVFMLVSYSVFLKPFSFRRFIRRITI